MKPASSSHVRAVSPPPVVFENRVWSAEVLAARASWWGHVLEPQIPRPPGLVALVMAPHPDTIALFFALISFPVPLILLPHDPRSWTSTPSLPNGTPVVLPTAARDLATATRRHQLCTIEPPDLPAHGLLARAGALDARSPGVVFLTSGSTGCPKPVYRSWVAILAQGHALNETLAIAPGAGMLAVLPLAGAHGFVNSLVQAALLGVPLGLLPRTDHRTILAAFASRRYAYMSATPSLASLLCRCSLHGVAPRAPAICRIAGGRLSAGLVRAFQERFGVTLRAQYGTTEYGTIAADVGTATDTSAEVVGRPLASVEVRLGDDPQHPVPRGAPGRIWVRSPWRMTGYGYPPHVEPRQDRAGWSPTQDVGVLDDLDQLSLQGRLDECFKVSSGYLVNPDGVTAALVRHPAVADAVVVPLPSPRGTLVGALVEAVGRLDTEDVRRHAARSLPSWAQPQVVCVTDLLPRLPGGKPDRQASIAQLTSFL